jgi:hypothetical protein
MFGETAYVTIAAMQKYIVVVGTNTSRIAGGDSLQVASPLYICLLTGPVLQRDNEVTEQRTRPNNTVGSVQTVPFHFVFFQASPKQSSSTTTVVVLPTRMYSLQ